MTDPILKTIKQFCRAQRIALSTFGILATNNKALVTRLKKGRILGTDVRNKCLLLMEGVKNKKIDISGARIQTSDPLLPTIRAFLNRHQMDPTQFGIAAVGDRALMTTLKGGRILREKTRARIRNYMKGQDDDEAES